jgi:UDP-N-acetylmuramate dehydrogenase
MTRTQRVNCVNGSVDRRCLGEMFASAAFAGAFRFDEPMSGHTTLRIGGKADVFVVPSGVDSLRYIVLRARDSELPVITLGGGSNVLILDGGIEGIVVSLASISRVAVDEEIADDEAWITAGAGAHLQGLVRLAGERGYSGIEGLAGIPGSVGGAVMGNAGSFGYEIGNVIDSADIMDRDGTVFSIASEDLAFRYRASSISEGDIILGGKLRLKRNDRREVSEKINAFFVEKRRRQPVRELSAGCVFRNPEGAEAGRLIDEAGCKGLHRGDVRVSGLHANFFVNMGSGKAADFLALMEDVKGRVTKAFGFELEPEIKIMGRE